MSNNFLERFKGKTQTVSKEGVHNVLGGKNEDAIVYTNINTVTNTKFKQSNSLNKIRTQDEPPKNYKNEEKKVVSHIQHQIPKPNQKSNASQQANHNNAAKQKRLPNPFLQSNPFYLDEEERQRQEKEKKERQRLQKEREKQKQKEKERQKQMKIDSKKVTQASISKSLDKKKTTDKEWVKLGGLGANIGGEQWLQRKKKLEKMQEFAGQVKSINTQKSKIPKPPTDKKQQKKEQNPRQKALQYSKNVPKPVIRVIEREEEPEQKEQPQTQQLTELQQYELKHEQLKNMLKNQL